MLIDSLSRHLVCLFAKCLVGVNSDGSAVLKFPYENIFRIFIAFSFVKCQMNDDFLFFYSHRPGIVHYEK